ncbi:MAG: hypothetical protein L0229_21760 [Blastocatellia bacterium]|nr:hypothetical protein [Blastocatellia bacterium]
MTDEGPGSGRYITIADCEICSKLAEVETSFYKYGHEEETRTLPEEASRLEKVDDPDYKDPVWHYVRRCPICGVCYRYDYSYEYLVYGSEDEEELRRLTPTQARRYLSDATYDFLIGRMLIDLNHPQATARHYAARSLTAHHLERQEMDQIERYLQHPDSEIMKGALFFLRLSVDDKHRRAEISQLKPVLLKLADSPDEEVARFARYILRQIK